MYYRAWTGDQTFFCALDSDDGLNWERPVLELVEFDGSTRNNITTASADHLITILDSREPDETRRWKQIDNKPSGISETGRPALARPLLRRRLRLASLPGRPPQPAKDAVQLRLPP